MYYNGLLIRAEVSHMRFASMYHNPYRPSCHLCDNCGDYALHKARRSGYATSLCCDCDEATADLPCEGHRVAGAIKVRKVTQEEIFEIWSTLDLLLNCEGVSEN